MNKMSLSKTLSTNRKKRNLLDVHVKFHAKWRSDSYTADHFSFLVRHRVDWCGPPCSLHRLRQSWRHKSHPKHCYQPTPLKRAQMESPFKNHAMYFLPLVEKQFTGKSEEHDQGIHMQLETQHSLLRGRWHLCENLSEAVIIHEQENQRTNNHTT